MFLEVCLDVVFLRSRILVWLHVPSPTETLQRRKSSPYQPPAPPNDTASLFVACAVASQSPMCLAAEMPSRSYDTAAAVDR